MGTLRDAIAAGMGSLSQAGNAYADTKQRQLQEMYKQFQMQQMTDELTMKKSMHDLESKKVSELLRQAKEEEERKKQPAYPIFKAWEKQQKGEQLEEGEPTPTVGDVPLLQSLSKNKPQYKQVTGTTAFVREDDPTQMVITGLEGNDEKTNYSVGGSYIQARMKELKNQGIPAVQAQIQASEEAREKGFEQQKNLITIRNEAGKGASYAPGTSDYMADLFEQTGQVPAFGMGRAGADQRKEFWDKVAQRASMKGDTAGEQAARKAGYQADSSALRDLTKRGEMIKSFVVRIDANTKVVEDLLNKYTRSDSRLVNYPMSKLDTVMGSGDLASLKLGLFSLSREVAKVESNSVGIAEVSVEAQKIMDAIHDPTLPVKEMMKVLKTGMTLGKTSVSAIEGQKSDLVGRIGKAGKKESPSPQQGSGFVPLKRKPGETIDDYYKRIGQ
jgi:hypothetical protein